MIKYTTINQKLFTSFLFIGSISTIFASFIFYQTTKKSILERTLEQLTSVKILKNGWINQYLDSRSRDLTLFTALYSTRNAFQNISTVFKKYGIEHPAYKTTDSSFKSSMQQFRLKDHFLNLWLITTEGEVIYTTRQNKFTGKNIFALPHLNPQFIEHVKSGFEKITFFDITHIDENNKQSYLLLFSPIKSPDLSRVIGCAMVKINFDDINHILAHRTGLGQTGESYVVGNDMLMRSKSRFILTSDSTPITVNTSAVQHALKGETGTGMFNDYRGIKVLSSYMPLSHDGVEWALMSEIDYDEAMKPVVDLRYRVVAALIIINLLIFAATYAVSTTISTPIKNLNHTIQLLGSGKLPDSFDAMLENRDEIGQISRSIAKLIQSMKQTAFFANEIGRGNFDAKFTPLSHEDTLGHALLDMRMKLVQLNQLIENQNRIRTQAIIEGQENERRRISRELHDGVGQMLTVLKLKVQEMGEEQEFSSQLKNLIDDTVNEIRRVSINLAPSVLYDFGLLPAVKMLIKNCGLSVDFHYDNESDTIEIPIQKRIANYRILQEALQNIQKHAPDAKVEIKMLLTFEEIKMQISDNGPGFDIENYLQNLPTSSGLINMKQRAELENGTFIINSLPGNGTRILTAIPL